ncbi:MAG: VWA domain-containing protein [Hyphomicrobiaceae bacterium]|nr:VWA domain-containing protein [Hyphomicrobiaceae bacterium]
MAFSYTDPTGTAWTIDNYGEVLVSRSGYSLYDRGSYLGFEGRNTDGSYSSIYQTYAAPTVTATSQTVNGTGTGANFSRQADVITDGGGNYVLRMTETFVNTGAEARRFRLTVSDNMYADSSTTTTATDSGDTVYTTADDWYATSRNTAGYPVIGHLFSGGVVNPTAVSHSYADSFATAHEIDLAAGASATFVHYVVVSAATATTSALLETLSSLPAWALAGLTQAQLDSLANYLVPVTASVTTTLLSYQNDLTLTGTANIDGTGNERDNVLIGNSGVNTLTGLGGNDRLDGGAGGDRMVGGAGNDTYVVDASADEVVENSNEGTDWVETSWHYSLTSGQRIHVENMRAIGNRALTLTGNASDNTIIGGGLNDTLNGLDGNDYLDGGAGTDRLAGGLGNDTFVIDAATDLIVESSNQGTDTVRVAFSNYVLGANLENLELIGGAAIGSGNAGANVITGNALINTLIGDAGDDTYVVQDAGDVIVETSTGGIDLVQSAARSFTLAANVENLTLLEGDGIITAIGNSAGNSLTGNSESNTLDGGAGADTMTGGLGSDTYFVRDAGDVVVEAPDGGIDIVRTTLGTYTLTTNIEHGALLTGGVILNGNDLNNTLTGNRASNTLSGGIGDDLLHGEGGNDVLVGGDGNDTLNGDRGAPGTTTASNSATVNGANISLTISAPETAQGTVTIDGTISSLALGDGSVNIVYIVDHSGSMSDSFQGTTNVGDRNGDGASNTTMDAAIASFERLTELFTQAGLGDRLNAALIPFSDSAEVSFSGSLATDGDSNGRADILDRLVMLRPTGGTNYTAALQDAVDHLSAQPGGRNVVFFVSDGAPNDRLYEETLLAQLRELGDAGTIIRAIGTGAGANEEVLDILDDGISNDSASIVLNPDDLNLSLTGMLAEIGDSAWVEIYRNDILVEIIGADQFTISPLGLSFSSGPLAISASGTDTISARLITSDAAGTTITTELPIQIGAFVSNDTLSGGVGDDTLNGGVGADSMAGGVGNDTYYVDNAGDIVTEALNEGTDTIVSSRSVTSPLTANVENLTLIGTAAIAVGNDLGNTIVGNALANTIDGGIGNDTIAGGDGGDRLTGGLGNDSIDGNAGNDILLLNDGFYDYAIGNAGDDTYFVDQNDYIYEYYNEGTDTVVVEQNSSLGGGSIEGVTINNYYTNYIENLKLVEGSSANNMIGSDVGNVLTGNSNVNSIYGWGGDDTLIGGGGNDLMDGGLGNDRFYVQDAGDVVVDAGGIDTVYSSITSYTLAAGIENLVFQTGAVIGIGNSGNNTITGNSAANTINGGTGNDTMAGGLGNDIYIVDSNLDRVNEAASAGTDTVQASVSFLLGANIEHLTLTGSGDLQGAGNGLNNNLLGNAGNNRLLGLDGNDSLNGGLGNDTLDGGAGNDTLNGAGGTDRMTGGAGADTFVFATALDSSNIDRVMDFTVADDTVALSHSLFAVLPLGTLAAGALRFGTVAVDADDRILYNSANGAFYYDADGSGAGAVVRVGTLSAGLALTEADFLIIA